MNKNTKIGLSLAGTAGLWVAAYNYPSEAGNIISTVAETTGNLLGSAGEFIQNWAETIGAPLIGGAAPFAAPMLAGGYTGKKLADILKIENKWARAGMIAGGTWLGAIATSSVAAPYLVWGVAAIALAKPALWTAKKIGKWISWVYWGVGWMVGGILKWGGNWLVHGAKEGYNNPSLIPKTGLNNA